MKTVKLEDLRRRNKERQHLGIEAARRVDPDFYPGKRSYTQPRKEGKRELLDKMALKEKEMMKDRE